MNYASASPPMMEAPRPASGHMDELQAIGRIIGETTGILTRSQERFAGPIPQPPLHAEKNGQPSSIQSLTALVREAAERNLHLAQSLLNSLG